MLKMFQAQREAAGSSGFWDESWNADQLPSVLADPAVCENDPLLPLFRSTLTRDRLFLEGGCGQAQWVKYFSDRGQRSVGIDFAERTISSVRRMLPDLDVRVGNILALPFADGSVHTYYSGGVVEHFEDGPEQALAEARRVIADDGWFLCSVPDESPLRRLLYRGGEVSRPDLDPALLVRRVDRTTGEAPPLGKRFFQYVFREEEFRRRLDAAGFTVERTFGCGLLWGLFEIRGVAPVYQTLLGALRGRFDLHAATAPVFAAPAADPAFESGPVGLLRRALVREDPTVPVLGPALRAFRERCANMRMYVARPRLR